MAIQKEIEIKVNTQDAVKSTDKLADSVDELNKNTSKGLKDVNKSAKSASQGIKAIGTSLKALGIGLIIAAFAKLQEVFYSNQKVADAFANVAETISLVFNDLVNTTIEVYEAVSKSTGGFDALGKVLGGLLKLSVTPLKLAFYGIKLGVQEAQLAWEKSFFGDKDQNTIAKLTMDILETKAALIETGEDAIQAGKDIGNNIVEAVGELTEFTVGAIDGISKISIKSAYESAKSIVQLKKSAAIAAAIQSGLVEQNDRLAEQQRQIRDDDQKSIAVRIKANEQLLVILEKQRADMKKQAGLQIAAAQADYDKNQSTENYIALIEAQNNAKAIEAQIEGFLSEQLTNKNSLLKEGNDLKNAGLEADIEIRKKQKEFEAELQKNELLKLELQKENLEAQKEIDLQELERKRELYAEGTQARVDAENEYKNLKQDIDNELILNDRATKEELNRLEKERVDVRLKALDDLTSIANAETGIGKTLLIAKQLLMARELIMEATRTLTFSTQAAARSTIAVAEGTAQTAKIGFPQNIPMLIGYAAQAVGIISAIKSATSKAGGSAGNIGSGINSATSAPTPPSFNLVQGTGSNQIAQGLNNQQQPIQAYVVSSNVTTAQSLDRNIVAGASL